jgi:ABC-type sugar transport system ATPase subunit
LIEVAKLSDRILVIRDGRLVNEIPGPLDNPDVLFELCAGKKETA